MRLNVAGGVQVLEQLLHNSGGGKSQFITILWLCSTTHVVLLGLLIGRGPSKVVKANAEPAVDRVVNLKVLVADLLRSHILGNSLGLRGSSVLVGAAHVQRDIPAETRVAGKDVSGQDATDDVAQVGNVVDIRQGRCN